MHQTLAKAIILFLMGGISFAHADAGGRLSPLPDHEWDYGHARHLLERAGFGGTPDEIAKLTAMGLDAAVTALVEYEAIPDRLPAFEHSGIWDESMHPDVDLHMRFDDVMRKAAETGVVYSQKIRQAGPRPLQDITDALYYKYLSSNREWQRVGVWWAERMLVTKRPLEEKMTLFWHGHFATEELKNDDYRLMLRQNETMRHAATSNLRTLLIALSQDPAMLLYLDNRLNVKGHANENYAREILELFSLGVGNYTEQDIKEAARALTGWRNQGLRFIDDKVAHDEGEKTLFGQSGNWDGIDVIDLILAQEACAEFIAGKLYRFFVNEEADPELLSALAFELRKHHYELKPFLYRLFSSRAFYTAKNQGSQIKSPIQFLISTYRKLGLTEIPGTPYFPMATRLLGQNLGNPPNVKGWDGGRAWLNPSTILTRNNLINHLLFPESAEGQYPRFALSPRLKNAPVEARARDLAEDGGSLYMEFSAARMSGDSDMSVSRLMNTTAPSAKMHNAKADYDLKLGLYRGTIKSFERVRPIPPTPAPIDLLALLRENRALTPQSAVNYLEKRFLSTVLNAEDKRAIVAFLQAEVGATIPAQDNEVWSIERSLRLTLHLILSTPEYQLG